MLAIDNARKPQKKYRQAGARVRVRPEKCRTVWYHIPPINHVQNTRFAVTSIKEFARGIRLGSRTGGSLRGSHSSKQRDLACALSSTATTVVIPPTLKNAIGQKALQNDSSEVTKLWPECAARETAIPIQT